MAQASLSWPTANSPSVPIDPEIPAQRPDEGIGPYTRTIGFAVGVDVLIDPQIPIWRPDRVIRPYNGRFYGVLICRAG